MKTQNYFYILLILISHYMAAGNNNPIDGKNKQTPLFKHNVIAGDNDNGIKGKFLIGANVGFNLWGPIMQAKYTIDYSYDELKQTTSPMYHFSLDYGIIKNVSAGLSFGYQTTTIKLREIYYSGPNNYQYIEYTDKWERFHFAVRGDYHIIANNNISFYTGLKFGYNDYLLTSNYSSAYYPKPTIYTNNLTINAHIGFSYFFKEVIGINSEVGIGIGGPYIASIGIAAKL